MRVFLGILILLDLLLMTEPAAANKRVALVIGNSAYRNVRMLANPAADAGAVSLLLKSAGFEIVQTRSDLGITEMRRAVRDFSDATRDAQIALVYYAGHGIEVDGTNYLVPVDATIERDLDVEDETVSLDRLLKVLEPARRLRLVILDACRDNPFARTMKRTIASRSIGRGLARVEPVTSDTLIAFAARAGSTAADGQGVHSPFTAALLKHIAEPGLDLRIAFGRVRDEVLRNTDNRQEPFVYGSLGGTNVALVPPLAEQPASARPATLTSQMAHEYELASKVGTKEAWESFLTLHPTGFYADLARGQRAKLIAAALSPPGVAEKQTMTPEPRARAEKKSTKTAALPSAAARHTDKKDRAGQKLDSGQHLRNCLADYVRRKGSFRPEGQSDKVYKSRSDMTSMCLFAISHRNYYWNYTPR